MTKIRYAIVGAGWISQEAFMPAVDQTGNSQMTAIVTGNADNARKLADFYGIEHVYNYEQYDEALASGHFDAVYIGLPNSLHAGYAIRAANRGIHAMVEKPLAVSIAECEAMINAAKSSSTKLMTAYRLHCEPGTVRAIELVSEGAIGQPRLFSSVFSFQSDPDNHRLKREHWGGPLQDIGVYCLNAARHLFRAEPYEVIAMKSHGSDPRFCEVEESLTATLRFPEDAQATFTVSFNGPEIDMYRIVGTEGEIEMSPGYVFPEHTRMVMRRGLETTETAFQDIDHFGAQTAYFSDCILTGEDPEPDGEEGLADVRALLAIEEAARTGTVQSISSPPRPVHPNKDMVRLVSRTDRRLVL